MENFIIKDDVGCKFDCKKVTVCELLFSNHLSKITMKTMRKCTRKSDINQKQNDSSTSEKDTLLQPFNFKFQSNKQNRFDKVIDFNNFKKKLCLIKV